MSAPRLFAAIRLPDSLRRELGEAGEALRRGLPRVRLRLTPPENLHLTLRFFGPERRPGDVERIEDALGALLPDLRCPVLAFAGIGAFPSRRRARILWAGFREERSPAGGPSRIAAVHQAAEVAARRTGFDRGGRDFVPHATIARLRAATPLCGRILAAAGVPLGERPPEDAAGRPFCASEVELLESTLTPQGAVYRRIARWRLAAGTPAAEAVSGREEAGVGRPRTVRPIRRAPPRSPRCSASPC